MEPTNFYDSKLNSLPVDCKALRADGMGDDASMAELSTAPAIYDDESAIDFSSYIDSMSSVPNLELCNDELFADLFNNTVKQEKAEFGLPNAHANHPLLPGSFVGVHKEIERMHQQQLEQDAFSKGVYSAPIKQEPDWSDSDMSSSLPSQIENCAQTAMSLHTGQPTPPTTPEPMSFGGPTQLGPRKLGKDKGGKKNVDRHSPEYRQRRERNNIAVRKSRDKAKQRNLDMQQKMIELGAENDRLHKTIEQLTRELTSLRNFFKQMPNSSFGVTVPIESRWHVNPDKTFNWWKHTSMHIFSVAIVYKLHQMTFDTENKATTAIYIFENFLF